MDKDKTYLNHILDAINLIFKFTKEIDKKEFSDNELVINAVIRQLEIVGEAAKKISKKLKEKHPGLPWKQAAGMRDNLIHEYFNVDLNQVWETVNINLPELKEKIIKLLKRL